MEFEKELKNKICKRNLERIEKNFQKHWNSFDNLRTDVIENIIHDILIEVKAVVRLYNTMVSDKNNQIFFDDKDITLNSLIELKKKVILSQSEKEYIEYQNELDFSKENNIEAIIEVLIRRLLSEKTNIENLTEFDKIREEKFKGNIYANRYLHIISLISGELFEESEDKFSKMISDRVEENFNFHINCGGYAFEIDTCIFPGKNDFDKSVSNILELFPFVRLVGDTQLQEDEYLVLYRCSKEGHHFIKQANDGTFLEKEGGNPPKNFEGWSEIFKNSPEAAFAVKKEHEMEYFDKYGSIVIPRENSMNFEETIMHAIKNMQNTFEYHNHIYSLKKTDEEMIYVCSNGKIVAQVLRDEKDYDIEIDEQSKRYISNTKPSVMENGDSEKQKNVEGDLHDR